jgi:hypothetical protein
VTGFGIVGHHGVIVGKAQRAPESLYVTSQGLEPGPRHYALHYLAEKNVVEIEGRTLVSAVTTVTILTIIILIVPGFLLLEGQLEAGMELVPYLCRTHAQARDDVRGTFHLATVCTENGVHGKVAGQLWIRFVLSGQHGGLTVIGHENPQSDDACTFLVQDIHIDMVPSPSFGFVEPFGLDEAVTRLARGRLSAD